MALLVARSGSGKSTLYLNIIRNTPAIPTVVVNMEMTPRRQIEWLTSMTYDLETPSRSIEEVLRFGADDSRYGEVVAALSGMGDHYPNLHFVSPSRPSISDLTFVLEDIENETGVRPMRVFVDHLGLMKGCTDYNGYSVMTSGLHSWALREELAVYVLQQTGRNDGSGGRNEGHLPVTVSSGVYTGEQDADWLMGMYRPDRAPKFKKSKYAFEDPEDYFEMLSDLERVRGITVFQVLKNRPFGDILEQGIELRYDLHTRRLHEPGAF